MAAATLVTTVLVSHHFVVNSNMPQGTILKDVWNNPVPTLMCMATAVMAEANGLIAVNNLNSAFKKAADLCVRSKTFQNAHEFFSRWAVKTTLAFSLSAVTLFGMAIHLDRQSAKPPHSHKTLAWRQPQLRLPVASTPHRL
jgi:hypothetical protein